MLDVSNDRIAGVEVTEFGHRGTDKLLVAILFDGEHLFKTEVCEGVIILYDERKQFIPERHKLYSAYMEDGHLRMDKTIETFQDGDVSFIQLFKYTLRLIQQDVMI